MNHSAQSPGIVTSFGWLMNPSKRPSSSAATRAAVAAAATTAESWCDRSPPLVLLRYAVYIKRPRPDVVPHYKYWMRGKVRFSRLNKSLPFPFRPRRRPATGSDTGHGLPGDLPPPNQTLALPPLRHLLQSGHYWGVCLTTLSCSRSSSDPPQNEK